MADICVVMNARSGRQQAAERIRGLEELFARYPDRFTLRLVHDGAEIAAEADRAVQDGFTTVVAAGGDGTINAVTSRLIGTGCRLGILPLGTFNYVARGLDLPETLEEAVRVVAEGQERPLDIGEVNGLTFLNNASLGAYPAILRRRERVYNRWGRSRLAAHLSVLATLTSFRASLRLRVTIDGQMQRFRTPLVFVANNRYQLELFGLGGGECLESHRFALYVAPDCGRLDLIRLAMRLALGRLRPERDFELFCGAEILVETDRRRRTLAHDGERMRMEGPFRFRLHREAVRVLVPAEAD